MSDRAASARVMRGSTVLHDGPSFDETATFPSRVPAFYPPVARLIQDSAILEDFVAESGCTALEQVLDRSLVRD
jgi:hypothetical protein